MATQPVFTTPSKPRDQPVYEKVRTCQYIHGEPRYRDFCSKPVREDQSWCDEHWELCRNKPDESKPLYGWLDNAFSRRGYHGYKGKEGSEDKDDL